MFSKAIEENNIPPNFLNSILTNPSLYDMFKNDFDSNREYFQGIDKEEYLREMLEFIESTLFSSNIYHIYAASDDLESQTKGKLVYIKTFYDDFLLDEFKKDPGSILKTKFFKGLKFALDKDLYASKTSEFMDLYTYVFSESLDYDGIVEVLLKEPIALISNGEGLTLKEFDTLCNYVKNNIEGKIDMSIVTGMLKNHAYKTNHIFDREVVEELVRSTVSSYLEEAGISISVVFENGLENKETSAHSFKTNTIYLDYSLVDGFISLNYVELFEVAFMEAEMIKETTILKNNQCDYRTLKVIMNLVCQKADLNRIFTDEDYKPNEYYLDLSASCFIKTLRFFASFGVNLLGNYANSKTRDLELDYEDGEIYFSKKEISLDQRFAREFAKLSDKEELIDKYDVLKLIFRPDGTRIRTIDLIKSLSKDQKTNTFLEEYLNSRIMEPEIMIEDVSDLSSYKPKNEYIKELIERELKYIYVDTFYYSLDSFIKLNKDTKLDLDEYLDDILIKVNCIKDTPLSHRFIDEAIFTISDAKQNL